MGIRIADREYRGVREIEQRMEELAAEYPGLGNRGSREHLRRTASKAVEEYELLGRQLATDREEQRWLERQARDPRGHEHTEERSLERILDGGATEHVRRAHQLGLRAVEHHERSGALSPATADRLDELIRRNDPRGIGSRYITAVADPAYMTAFSKILRDPVQGHLRFSREEVDAVRAVTAVEEERGFYERGQSLTGAQGGFAVPFELDPTILLTSAGVVNPIRRISRVIPIAVDEWRGVSSAGVSAAYEAEATEVAESTATLVQPTLSTEKGHVFVPFTIEIGQDWTGLAEELRVLMADAKDTLEAGKFATGTGTNEPFGVLVGTTNTVNASSGQTFTRANGFALSEALPPRYKPNAAFVADERIWNRIRQFESAAGAPAAEWREGAGPEGSIGTYLGKPAYEGSEFPDTPATGNKFLLLGDFSRYVVIERIGTTVELIPHLFGANRRPTGQRGLYCFFRNSAKVVDANAFRALIGVA
jgi:HK97 family phage major capsid protein